MFLFKCLHLDNLVFGDFVIHLKVNPNEDDKHHFIWNKNYVCALLEYYLFVWAFSTLIFYDAFE